MENHRVRRLEKNGCVVIWGGGETGAQGS